jgi:hypothetical protein
MSNLSVIVKNYTTIEEAVRRRTKSNEGNSSVHKQVKEKEMDDMTRKMAYSVNPTTTEIRRIAFHEVRIQQRNVTKTVAKSTRI